MWPRHWNCIDCAVFVDLQDFLDDKVDIVGLLRAIPDSRVREMQLAIQKNSRAIIYHKTEDYIGEDALDIMMNDILENANLKL